MNLNLFSKTEDDVAVDFPASYQQIIERINRINPIQYSKTRNFINGAVTYLSPYISRGVISVKQVMDAVLQKGYKPYQIEKFLQELAWREYFQRIWQHTADEIWLVQGSQRLLKASELQLSGLHNFANALAALALCRAIDLPMQPLLAALRNFKGLPHRVEHVAEIKGVIYYDDSKGTNVGATVAALQGLGRKAVLIAGGEGKGQDFAPLKPVVAHHARAVVLIGRDAPLIATALNGCGVNVTRANDMNDAVQQAAKLAHSGDAVLLSPACASFDMFRDYVHRAEMFIAAVLALQGEAATCAPQA